MVDAQKAKTRQFLLDGISSSFKQETLLPSCFLFRLVILSLCLPDCFQTQPNHFSEGQQARIVVLD